MVPNMYGSLKRNKKTGFLDVKHSAEGIFKVYNYTLAVKYYSHSIALLQILSLGFLVINEEIIAFYNVKILCETLMKLISYNYKLKTSKNYIALKIA